MTSPIGANAVILPSRGLFYDGKVPDGKVSIRKLTVGEDVILQSTTSGIDVIAKLVAACVTLPNGFQHDRLLVTDRLALLIALRIYTFGPKYTFSYKCQECGAANKSELNLAADLKTTMAKDDQKEPIEVDLTDCGKRVGLRFLRGYDEAQIARVARRLSLQNNDAGDPSIVTRMALQLVTIDGEPAGDLAVKEAFVKAMTMPDAQDWQNAVSDLSSGVGLLTHHDCSSCGSVNELGLPFTGEFFRPARHRP